MSNERPVPFSTTILVRDECLCLHTQRAARALARQFDKAFRPLGISNGQFSLLMSLNRPEPPSMGPVADLLAMDRTTLTAMLKPLDRRGLIEILPGESDRRERRIRLTDEGQRLLAEAFPIWTSLHGEIGKQLPENSVGRLREELLTLSNIS